MSQCECGTLHDTPPAPMGGRDCGALVRRTCAVEIDVTTCRRWCAPLPAPARA